MSTIIVITRPKASTKFETETVTHNLTVEPTVNESEADFLRRAADELDDA